MALTFAVALACAATARASYYKMLLCAGNVGSNGYGTATNTTSPTNPGGIFSFENYCGPAPDPAGNNAFLRIDETQPSGNAGAGAVGAIYWDAPPWVTIAQAGGYTREPSAFSEGWRAEFVAEGYDGSLNNILMQGAGVANGSLGGVGWGLTPVFGSHLWQWGGSYGAYRRFVFQMACVRPAGCDRAGFNAVDANTLNLTLNDVSPSQIGLTGEAALLSGQWVRGTQNVTWNVSDLGSGMRYERLRLDGNLAYAIDWRANCNLDATATSGEFARDFAPCPTGGPWGRSWPLNTATLADGAHTVQVCSQDYGQSVGIAGTGGESCDARTIHTDNTAPGAPTGLHILSANPNRYLSHFGAAFALPPNSGSPIKKMHYEIIDGSGKVVVPEQVVSATNPTQLSDIVGPSAAGDYSLRVRLEDEVGLIGPAAVVQVPHDTTPPAAPQELAAVGPTSWGPAQGYRLHWRDVTDEGSPIVAAHYQVLDEAANVVEPTVTVKGENVTAVPDLATPRAPGNYKAKVWLEDEEGNVGAAASAVIPRDTTPPAAPQDLAVTAPGVSRTSQGFDVHWRDVTDGGSPIVAAHYRIENGSGAVVVPAQTVKGENLAAVPDLEAPVQRGDYTLRIWLEDAEGNVGVAATAPLAYECVRSDASGGEAITSGLGDHESAEQVVAQGEGSTLKGRLSGHGGGIEGASVCVFSQVVTDQAKEFLGIAMTGADGSYRFAIPAGASRELSAVYRSGARELSSRSTIETIVHPTFEATKKVVYNTHVARFTGTLPGPDNDRVLVVAQVKRGKGWLAFHRYRTRADGHVDIAYRFNKTFAPTRYQMRLQVRTQSGYPYLQGNSDVLGLVVRPKAADSRRLRRQSSRSARPPEPAGRAR
jgi:hypothetical protein